MAKSMPIVQRVRSYVKRGVDRLRNLRGGKDKGTQVQEAKSTVKTAETKVDASKGQETVPSAGILTRPLHSRAVNSQIALMQKSVAATSASSLNIALVNRTTSSQVYVYIVGLALNNNNAWFLLQSDGSTPYYPTSPSSTIQPLQANVAIQLGAPGSTRTVTIPQLAGARIFVSIGSPLTFYLNPGPALVEPSVTNPSDPNFNIQWDFAEFTFNGGLYANITYVDFVSIPISLQLQNTSGATQTVTGMPANGLDTICANLQAQSNSDGVAGWKNLVVTANGKNLRALSPNSDLALRPGDFANYFEPYVEQVWQKYTTSTLTVKTPDNSINTSGMVTSGNLTLGSTSFTKPSTADIFSCSTGPFATGSDATRNVLIPQLAAAFNRTTLLKDTTTPAPLADFYQNSVTNHYARIVHAANVDGKGYAFPYDDVNPAEGTDQSGFVSDPNPQLLTVTFGGW
ncbi:uncharacterized protein PV09_00012 [Verruconis gallopava]|uniref:GH64 domain-containing protein n=1 Tax=Verruconis gallopava TaxID=253628 RepID=A0A0D2AQW2_9PEZI|nr:uncharacterized protein PV09_00012 [Verruconis gallopava]KIW09063.1 hypothetical protein PV09_00012 [Verruconis gallopava]